MMELKNLPALYFIYRELRFSKIPFPQLDLVHDIVNLHDLEKMIKIYPQFDWTCAINAIEKGKKVMDEFNKSNKKLDIYKTKGYSNIKLEKMDSQNFVKDLIVLNPTNRYSGVWGKIENKSIETIKKELQLTNIKGQNYVLKTYRGLNIEKINYLISAINMYEEQIERQYKIYRITDINLFEERFNDKNKIVSDNYNSIVDYLIKNNDKDLVWGKLSDNQCNLFLNSTNTLENEIRQRLIKYIAHYTTLDELEQVDKGNMKILTRFIK